MFIIVEGVDCCGKGYIATRLLKLLPHSFLIKQGIKPKTESAQEISDLKASYDLVLSLYDGIIGPAGGNLIADRLYPSELVYSKIKRGYEAFNDSDYFVFEGVIRHEVPSLLVYVDAPLDLIQQRMISRGDDYITMEDLPRLIERYERFITETELNFFRFRNDGINLDLQMNRLVEVIEELKDEWRSR